MRYLFLLYLLLSSGNSSNKKSGGYIIFGDSLSEGNGIGEHIASFLRNKGINAVSIAKSGRSAKDYQSINDSDIYNKKVIYILGTNDSLKNEKENHTYWANLTKQAHQKALSFLIIGPPDFSNSAKGFHSSMPMNEAAEKWVSYMKSTYPKNFMDIRDLSSDLVNAPYRKSDGIHFTDDGTEEISKRLIKLLFG